MDILQSQQFLFLVMAGGAAVLLVATLALTGRKTAASRRLEQLSENGGASQPGVPLGSNTPVSSDQPGREQFRNPEVEKELKKQEQRLRLIQAGLYSRSAAAIFMVIRIALFAGFVGTMGTCAMLGLIPLKLGLLGGAVAAIFATIAPSFWLDKAKKRRQTVIRRALPDALDILGVCMAGGLSLQGAIGRVARELATAHPALALELAIVDRETQLGRSVGQALREFAYRFDMEELRNLSTVILQAEKFGSSLTKTLDIYAETLRLKRQQRAEELAQKAAIKILFPTLFCIFPAMFVVILGPAAIRIYSFLMNNEALSGGGGGMF